MPQLLLYPNPHDPLNPEAASLLLKSPDKYSATVSDYVKKFALQVNRKVSDASTKPDQDNKDDSDFSQQSDLSMTSDILSDF